MPEGDPKLEDIIAWKEAQAGAVEEATGIAEEVIPRAKQALEKLRSANDMRIRDTRAPKSKVDDATMMGIESRLRNLIDEAEQLVSYKGIRQY